MRVPMLTGTLLLLAAVVGHATGQNISTTQGAGGRVIRKCSVEDDVLTRVGRPCSCGLDSGRNLCGLGGQFSGVGACVTAGDNSSTVCEGCGKVGERCCPGGRAPNFACGGSFFDPALKNSSFTGYCTAEGNQYSMCTACGGKGEMCCPGPEQIVKKFPCHYQSSGCIAPTSSPVCEKCGVPDKPCCPGSSLLDPCGTVSADGVYLTRRTFGIGGIIGDQSKAFCMGAAGGDLTCSSCGDFTGNCCPDDAPGNRCRSLFADTGFCTERLGAMKNPFLECAPCGMAGTQCCPGSKEGDQCDSYLGTAVCVRSKRGLLQCRECGGIGQLCCKGKVGSECARDFGLRTPVYEGICTAVDSKVICKSKCPCPKMRSMLQNDPNFDGTLFPVQAYNDTAARAGRELIVAPEPLDPTMFTPPEDPPATEGSDGVYEGTGEGVFAPPAPPDIDEGPEGSDGVYEGTGEGILPPPPLTPSGNGTFNSTDCDFYNLYFVGVGQACCPYGTPRGQCNSLVTRNATQLRRGFCSLTTGICRGCGLPGEKCCPGASLEPNSFVTTPCYLKSRGCIPRAGMEECKECGGLNQKCCPGSTLGSSCRGPSGLDEGVCVKEPNSNASPPPLICRSCGTYGDECCPGSVENSACGSQRGRGFCKAQKGKLVCYPCGFTTLFPSEEITLPCCPGSFYGDSCGIDDFTNQGFLNGFTGASCFAKSKDEAPICRACGQLGEPCCPGNDANDECSQIGYTFNGYPIYDGYCKASEENTKYSPPICERKCTCPRSPPVPRYFDYFSYDYTFSSPPFPGNYSYY